LADEMLIVSVSRSSNIPTSIRLRSNDARFVD
jgi:hypothetical protein